MRALRRFREERPDVLVHPASMTSLNIAESFASGRPGGRRSCAARSTTSTASPACRWRGCRSITSPCRSGTGSPRPRSSTPHDLEHEPLLIVDRGDAPQAHDVITGYLNRLGVRPTWVTHGATQIERVFDMVAIGSGIGWLNTWQAEREAGRTDVAIRPLQPIGMWDEFRVAWRAGDTRPATAACVRVVLETCGPDRSG